MPGRQACLDFAVKVGAELPSRAREIAAERARVAAAFPGSQSVGLLPAEHQKAAGRAAALEPVQVDDDGDAAAAEVHLLLARV